MNARSLCLSILLAAMAGCAASPAAHAPPPSGNRTLVQMGFCEPGVANPKTCRQRSALVSARVEAAGVCEAEHGAFAEVAISYYDQTDIWPQWGTGENATLFIGVKYTFTCTGTPARDS